MSNDTQWSKDVWPYKAQLEAKKAKGQLAVENGSIWQGKYGEWHSRCPRCTMSKSHKSLLLAVDKQNVPCRSCRIETGTNYWAMLRLLRQETIKQAKQAMEEEI
jgi:hypothetical protein